MTEFNHQDNSNHPLRMIIWIKLMGLVPWLSLCWLNEAIQIYSCEKWVSCNKRSQQFRFLCFRSACQEHHALEWGLSKNCASRDCQNIGGELWRVSVFTSAFSSSWGMAQTSIQVLIYLLDCCCYHHIRFLHFHHSLHCSLPHSHLPRCCYW